jgi:polysaccharide pyruvyl transferase WcaK-like protein
MMKRAVQLADRRTYRDAPSKNFLRSIGIDTSSDSVVPDLVFALPPERLPSDPANAGPATTIGIGVMAYYGWSNDRAVGASVYGSYIAKLNQFVAWLLAEGYSVRLLSGERGTDDRAVSDVRRGVSELGMGSSSPNLFAERIDSLDDLLREISRTDAVVASRFHNVVCALALMKPVLAIGYATKFDALMTEMGLAEYCQRIDELDVERLKTQFRHLVGNRTPATLAIRRKGAEYRQELNELYDSLSPPKRPPSS